MADDLSLEVDRLKMSFDCLLPTTVVQKLRAMFLGLRS
jgi:hypothetical protein